MTDIKALLREAATYVGPCGDTELVEQLLAAAEKMGEPVAWLCITDDGNLVDAVVTDAGKGIYELCGRTIQPLYLAPPPTVPEGMMFFPVEAWEFLTGEGPLDGVWFGERHPQREGRYWWRSYIDAMIAAAKG